MRLEFATRRERFLLFCATVGLAFGLAAASESRADGQTATAEPFHEWLDKSDFSHASSSLQRTLETNVSDRAGIWRNESSGNSGSIVPLRTFRIESGNYCREYRETIIAGQRAMSRLGTACRDQNGAWIPVELE